MNAAWASLSLLLSGLAGLAFETLWFRQAKLAFGGSLWASSLVTAAFMLGLAAGGWVASRFGPRLRRPFLLCAWLELAIAASGVALVHLLPLLSVWQAAFDVEYEHYPLLVRGLRLLHAELWLIVPTVAMGCTLPLAVHGLRSAPSRLGVHVGLCYGSNTLGATAGALLCELWLIEQQGVAASALWAGAVNLAAAALFFGLHRRLPESSAATPTTSAETTSAETTRPAKTERPAHLRPATTALVLAAALSGCAMLGLEIVWLRLLSVFLADTPLAFAVVLALLLAGLATGGLVAGIWLRRRPAAYRAAPTIGFAAAFATIASVRLFPWALERFFTFGHGMETVAPVASSLCVLPALLSGCFFTLLVAALGQHESDVRATGLIAFANSLGSAVGALLGAFVLLPLLGMERSLLTLSLAQLAAGSLCLLSIPAQRRPRQLAIGGAAALCCVVAFPFGTVQSTFVRGSVGRFMGPDDEIVSVREGLTATLVHVKHRLGELPIYDQLATNSYSMSANHFEARRYMKLFVYLPQTIHPKLSRALVVGYGLGSTAKALVDNAALERLDIVDTSPETLDIGRALPFDRGPHPLEDERVVVHLDDGRHYLAGTRERYDLITGEPPPPFLAGMENLYSQDFFSLVRSRLAPGGFASYWLPLMNLSADGARSIVAAFCGAFSDCTLWHGAGENFMLLGSNGHQEPTQHDRLSALWSDAEQREELAAIGFEHPVQFGPLFIGDAAYLHDQVGDTPPLTDDFPHRIRASGSRADKLAFVATLNDTAAARKRFMSSATIARYWDAAPRKAMATQFSHQKLINDLLAQPFGKGGVRSLSVLTQVMQQSPWVFPVLLLLHSDPDTQTALQKAPVELSERPRYAHHHLAAAIAHRDLPAAKRWLARVPKEDLLWPELADLINHAQQ